MAHYLDDYREFSDIQEAQPRALSDLEEQTIDAFR
jgi:hypothetical protein